MPFRPSSKSQPTCSKNLETGYESVISCRFFIVETKRGVIFYHIHVSNQGYCKYIKMQRSLYDYVFNISIICYFMNALSSDLKCFFYLNVCRTYINTSQQVGWSKCKITQCKCFVHLMRIYKYVEMFRVWRVKRYLVRKPICVLEKKIKYTL